MATNDPVIAVVTATYNALEGLKTTVASVAAQTFASVEHIIVDGGSTDGTQDFLRSLSDNVRWVSEPDEGIADAMNKGIAMARGQYVLVLHSQDRFFRADSLEQSAPFLANGTDIVSCDVFVEEHGKLRLVRSNGGGLRGLVHMPVPHQAALCRRELFERIGNFDKQYRIAMDYDWFLRARAAGASIVSAKFPLSIMPATGISSRSDWAGLSARLNEFKALHLKHAGGAAMRGMYHAYWAAYRPFKFCHNALKNRVR